jgi:hypothetical protein
MTYDVLIDCVAVLLGDYDSIRKKAAHILLKYFAPEDLYEFVMQEVEKEAPVTDRRDPRVVKWRNEILKHGCCECCGSMDDLEAHHVLYWSESPKDRINLNNGMCLCHECHTKEHEGEHVYHLMLSKK